MIRSMTGFGRCEASDEYRKVAVEIKAVNHRYLDLNLKIPRYFSAMEAQIRNEIKKSVFRGKVDVTVSYEDYSEGQTKLHYNKELAGRYLSYLKEMEEGRPGSTSRREDILEEICLMLSKIIPSSVVKIKLERLPISSR